MKIMLLSIVLGLNCMAFHSAYANSDGYGCSDADRVACQNSGQFGCDLSAWSPGGACNDSSPSQPTPPIQATLVV